MTYFNEHPIVVMSKIQDGHKVNSEYIGSKDKGSYVPKQNCKVREVAR